MHCALCGREEKRISAGIGVCRDCILQRPSEALALIQQRHAESRRRFGLPPAVPKGASPHARRCGVCANECEIPPGEKGFCGLRTNDGQRLRTLAGDPNGGLVSWYHDPLPTNCVASWVCPAGTGSGFPRFALRPGPEYGYYNLAVFYETCSFDCLFCQNWHFRNAHPLRSRTRLATSADLARAVTERDTCICFFGGDPGPQIGHALHAARLALQARRRQPLRICWETNGQLSQIGLRAALDISLRTGGCIKFDLKSFSDPIHIALTGVSNARVLQNFAWAARQNSLRPEPPLVVASTLLVPGYVTAEEVAAIASFIASLDPRIPYSLLAFAPQFEMADLPPTSRQEAEACLHAALDAGLTCVRIGNAHLLWDESRTPFPADSFAGA